MLAKDIEARPREWLADGYLPRGRVTLITGSRGIGKGLVTCWLSAQVTKTERPVSVWINSLAEDDLAEDLRPRLEVAGADLSRVRLTDTEYSLPEDLKRLATDIREFGADINFLDSLQTHLRTMSVDAENRTLTGLREMAKELGVAIVVLHHLLKSITTTTSVTQAIGGSGAIQNRSKVIYIVGNQPGEDAGSIELRELRAKLTGGEDDSDQREKLVLACERGWAGPIPSISFAKTTKLYAATGADEMYLEPLGEVGCTAQQVLSATAESSKGSGGSGDGMVQSVARWILETLASQSTRMLSTNTLIEMAKKEDIYVRATFDRARSRAGVKAISPTALPLYLSEEDYAALSNEQRGIWWVAI
jgi:AAA domain